MKNKIVATDLKFMNRTHSFKLAAQKQNYEEKGNFVVKTKETFTFLS